LKEQKKIQFELSRYEVLLIGNALASYQNELEIKLTKWNIKDEGKEMLNIIREKTLELEKKFKDF
jgi:hypothetical protein